ncbi:MAG: MerR family transcriptional regulator [Alphaproteobacteria bacterium]|nr:MerR family transcriptional regulator [Alphaproteobacteria bacterium]
MSKRKHIQSRDYSVGQLARISGVSVRTLHHYDHVGLLKPAHLAENGYRIYGHKEALRLQEILFYRDVGMSLSEIVAILDAPVDAVDRLTRHRNRLAAEAQRTARTIETLDATIAHLKGIQDMTTEELYRPFSTAKQSEYQDWLISTCGGDIAERIKTSNEAIRHLPDGMEGAMARLRDIEARLVAAFETATDPSSDQIRETLEDHRRLMAQLWGQDCPPEGYDGLAKLYRSHPDFVARYETLSPKFSHWLPLAMEAHVARLLTADDAS